MAHVRRLGDGPCQRDRQGQEWSDPPTTVVWTFTEMPGAETPDGATFLEVRNFGFAGTADEQVKQAIGSTDGFALVLAGAKAWLEQGLSLGPIGDRYPKGVPGR